MSKYEAMCQGPEKWKKLLVFLQQRFVSVVLIEALPFRNVYMICFEYCSLEGPLVDLINKQIDQIGSEKTALALKCRSIEDKMNFLNKQLEASEKFKSEYLKRYEDATSDKKKLAEDYASRIANLQSKYSALEERYTGLSKTLDSTRIEAMEWKRKYEQVLSKQKTEEEHSNAEISILKARTSAAEARVNAAKEQAESAQEEAEEWKRKYSIAAKEAKNALEKAAAVQERTNKQAQSREDALRDEFSSTLANKVIST